ncbi:MAG: hypothetical protein AAF561_00035 [Planctomycetota bacterium]
MKSANNIAVQIGDIVLDLKSNSTAGIVTSIDGASLLLDELIDATEIRSSACINGVNVIARPPSGFDYWSDEPDRMGIRRIHLVEAAVAAIRLGLDTDRAVAPPLAREALYEGRNASYAISRAGKTLLRLADYQMLESDPPPSVHTGDYCKVKTDNDRIAICVSAKSADGRQCIAPLDSPGANGVVGVPAIDLARADRPDDITRDKYAMPIEAGQRVFDTESASSGIVVSAHRGAVIIDVDTTDDCLQFTGSTFSHGEDLVVQPRKST